MIVVRLGSTDDASAALEVFLAAEAARRSGPVDAAEEERVGGRLRDGSGWLLLAEDDGLPVGMAVGYDSRADDGAGDVIPGMCHLGMVFVRPHLWGRGVGGMLIDAVLTEACTRGYSHIQLWTHEDNSRGQRLYVSRGFTPAGRVKDDLHGQPIGLWERGL